MKLTKEDIRKYGTEEEIREIFGFGTSKKFLWGIIAASGYKISYKMAEVFWDDAKENMSKEEIESYIKDGEKGGFRIGKKLFDV